MPLGDETWKQAQIMLNTAARRLLLWKDWWRDNRERLLEAATDNDPYSLGEQKREIDSALWRLKDARSDAQSYIMELEEYDRMNSYSGPSSRMPSYDEREEVAVLVESLDGLEVRLQEEVDRLKELEEAARRLLQKGKEEKKTA